MAEITQEIRAALDAADSAGIAARWRMLLMQRYAAGSRAKRVANDFGCAAKTAEKWLAGEPVAPSAANLMRGILIFGAEAVMGVLTPPAAAKTPTIDQLEASLARLLAMIGELRQEVRR